MIRCVQRIAAAAVIVAAALAPGGAAAGPPDGETPYAVSVVGAWMTDNDWKEIATLDDVGFRDAWLGGAMLSYELAGTEQWALEAEGHVIRHFGRNDHWEVNAVAVGRWRDFPWDERLPTSIAFGVGPSLASEVPAEEEARSGGSAPLLLYWMAEIEAGPPDSQWSGFARLHHRSSAYGLFADRGGSNWLMLGARYRF